MTPAQRLIERFGGAANVAEAAGVHWTTPYKWTWSKERGGTGGYIPVKHHEALLGAAKVRGIDLHWLDLVRPPEKDAA